MAHGFRDFGPWLLAARQVFVMVERWRKTASLSEAEKGPGTGGISRPLPQ